MDNVLIISYYFPPSGGPGVQRVLKFTRYLPAHGYRPHVLTVPETAAFPLRDPSLAREIPPEAEIHRSPIGEFYRLYRTVLGRGHDSRPVNLVTSARSEGGLRERLLQGLRASFFIPDGRLGWLPGGTRVGLEICRKERISLLFASGPPFTGHWIALRLARKTGLPLVLDFRDPWTRAPFYPRRPPLARALDERLERACLRSARAVVTVNRAIGEDFLQRYPDLDPGKFVVITNGFDPADFHGRVRNPSPLWTLTHTGTLPSGGLPPGLALALQECLAEEPEMRERMKIRLLGQPNPRAEAQISEARLEDIVRLEGYQPHEQSIQALLDSHLLLLMIEGGAEARGMLTGKLFEYLGSGRPILALAPEGEAAEILRSTGAGSIVAGDDVAGIKEALRRAWTAYREGRPWAGPDPAAVAGYARPALTARLAGLFDSLRVGSKA